MAASRSSPRITPTSAPQPSASPDRRLFERVGPEHIRRRVDEIAPERDRGGDPLEPRRIDPIRRDQPRLGRAVGLEASVAVGSEQERERSEIRFVRRMGEAIDALRQGRRELAGEKRIAPGRVGGVDSEQHAREPTPLPGQELQRAGFRLEAAALGEGRSLSADRRLDRAPGVGVDEPDRNGVWRRRGKGLQRSVSIERGTSVAAYHGLRPALHPKAGLRHERERRGPSSSACRFKGRGRSMRQATGWPLVTQREQLSAASCLMIR